MTYGHESPASPPINLNRLIQACLRNAVWVALFAAGATAVLWLVLARVPAVYSATSVVWVDTSQSKILSSQAVLSSLEPGQHPNVALLAQSQLLTSVPILRRVVEELDLEERPEVLKSRLALAIEALSGRGAETRVRVEAGSPSATGPAAADGREVASVAPSAADGEVRLAQVLLDVDDDATASAPPDAHDEALVQWATGLLAENLEVTVDPASELVSVTFTSADPSTATSSAPWSTRRTSRCSASATGRATTSIVPNRPAPSRAPGSAGDGARRAIPRSGRSAPKARPGGPTRRGDWS